MCPPLKRGRNTAIQDTWISWLARSGHDDRPQFATSQTDRGWTNLGVEFGPPTRVGVDHRGHERNLPICTGHIDRTQFGTIGLRYQLRGCHQTDVTELAICRGGEVAHLRMPIVRRRKGARHEYTNWAVRLPHDTNDRPRASRRPPERPSAVGKVCRKITSACRRASFCHRRTQRGV